ncbi:MAG: PASTA domain-containing protein [Acidobacteria bacterium]|nr:PASTA domain-containing protein [Acidobacteriota bacterium]
MRFQSVIEPIKGLFRRKSVRRGLILATWIAAWIGGLVMVGALSAYYTVRYSVSGRVVQVPDLTNKTIQEGRTLLREQGLILEEAAQRNDDRIAEGRIIEQEPSPGVDIKLQRKVKVVVSLGDKITPIPDMRGGAARKAQITLQQEGMRLGGQVYIYTKREGENLVVGQDPYPGSSGIPERGISLLVSRGDRPLAYVMPNLIGRRQSEVIGFLSRAGLKRGPVMRSPDHPAPQGTIIAQSPAAGYRVRHGDLVTLTIASRNSEDG